ncbi:MAG: chorismate mutase [Candidatus Izemoplasma sp.]|nr:chorismate mutase [Candidatus Izemoplasma sp.]
MDDLSTLRNKIDDLDSKIMALLEQRFNLSRAVGEYKKKYNLPVLHSNREQEIFDKTSRYSNYPQIKEIYKTILKTSKDVQN